MNARRKRFVARGGSSGPRRSSARAIIANLNAAYSRPEPADEVSFRRAALRHLGRLLQAEDSAASKS